MAMNQRQSIVVLAGWLGCQAKALQKYERLYQRLLQQLGEGTVGRQNDRTTTTTSSDHHDDVVVVVLPRIAPPPWIVQACIGRPENMDAMARQLIGDIQEQMDLGRETTPRHNATDQQAAITRRSDVYFHAFSNAGCILWDRFRDELVRRQGESINNSNNKAATTKNENVLQCIRGVIFDSCPIVDLSLIREALKYCTWQERAAVIRECGGGLDYMKIENLRPFGEQFQSALRTDPLRIPQLYLYSRNDLLTPNEFVHDLIDFRRRRQQQRQSPSSSRGIIINSHCWDNSAHCAHLLRHPESYEAVVAEFLNQTRQSTMTGPSPRSKL